MKKTGKRTIITLVTVFLVATFSATIFSFPSVSGMFKLNKQLQEEGYYMAEFEFKMLGILYYLDRGHYYTAYSKMTALEKQLKTREGLIKLPTFKNREEEMDFYLGLQNPDTGAFMDSSYPYCSYTGPTGNVLDHLDSLSREIGKPLKLKYPLKYLDEINTPEKLVKYLDDVSTVGWLGNKFPQTTFHFARDLLSLFSEGNVIEKYGLHKVSPEWKTSLVRWFYEKQDPKTGLWGPMSKDGDLRRKDTMNTASILKAFIDDNGKNKNEKFPLRYRDEMARSFLDGISKSIPDDDDLDDWHEWNLDTSKSLRTLVRYLWGGLNDDTKFRAKNMIENYLKIKHEKFYIPTEGAFSYYPGAEHATLDGTGGLVTNLIDYGFFSNEKRSFLWGKPGITCIDVGNYKVGEIVGPDITAKIDSEKINSLRFYDTDPDSEDYTEKALGVFYPKKAAFPDIVELLPKIKSWAEGTQQSMGNWTSRMEILQELAKIKTNSAPVYYESYPLAEMNTLLKKNKKVVIIGFDVLQVPRFKIVYTL